MPFRSQLNIYRAAKLHSFTVWTVLLIHGLLLGRIAIVNAPTFDEIAHLPAGLAHWRFGTFDLYRVNPPLMRMIAVVPLLAVNPKTDWTIVNDDPYARPEFPVGRRFMQINGYDSFWYFTMCRWAQIPVSVFGGWICYRWARDLYGKPSSVIALTLWCFCPNVLAWGSTITPDLGAAAFGVAAGYTFWKWLKSPTWAATLIAGGALGLAELSKSTWIGLFFLWPLLWFLWRNRIRPPATPAPPILQLTGILLIALYLLNLGYGFEDSLRPLGQFSFISRSLGGTDAHESPNNRFRDTWLRAAPVPVPANYLKGIDVQKYDFERTKWSYLRGEQKRGGWYHYYVYALLVKTPAGTLVLLGLACFPWATLRVSIRPFFDEIVLLIPAIAIIALVSSQTGINRYLRYVLPALPFLYVFASRVGAAFESAPPPYRILCGVALTSAILSSLSIYPHSMSYFSLVAGGPIGGPSHLLDANIDWGQDLLELKRFADRHPEAHPIRLAYFGYADPRLAGFDDTSVGQEAAMSEERLAPGWYAVSVNHLNGYRHFDSDKPIYTHFQRYTPEYLVGYSIYVYHITSEDLVRSKRLSRSVEQSPAQP